MLEIENMTQPTLDEKSVESSALEEALSELSRNTSVRRMLLITLNLIVPACVLSSVRIISLEEISANLVDIQMYCIPALGILITVASILVGYAILRCQFGIVVNAAIVNWMIYGKGIESKVNFMGITAGFYILATVSIALGMCITIWWYLLNTAPTLPVEKVVYLSIFFLFLVLGASIIKLCDAQSLAYRVSYKRKIRYKAGRHFSKKNEHRIKSLDDTNDDIALIVIQGAVLVSGVLLIVPTILSVPADNIRDDIVPFIRHTGILFVAAYVALILWMFQSLILRLRVAMAEHATQIYSDLDNERLNQLWKGKVTERTSVLYLFISSLCATLIVLVVYLIWVSLTIALIVGVLFLIASRVSYFFRLKGEYKEYSKRWAT